MRRRARASQNWVKIWLLVKGEPQAIGDIETVGSELLLPEILYGMEETEYYSKRLSPPINNSTKISWGKSTRPT